VTVKNLKKIIIVYNIVLMFDIRFIYKNILYVCMYVCM